MAREGMIFYRSFRDALKNLPDEIRLQCYDAIFSYGLDGADQDLEGVAAAIFALVKPQIDANNKRRENGIKGGRPALDSEPKDNQSGIKAKPNNKQTETKAETKEKEKEKEKVKDNVVNILSGKPDQAGMRLEIIDYLNKKTGKEFRHSTKSTAKLIEARLNDGYTVDDFKKVIDKKCAEWIETDQEQYLRPETLFKPAHFESYLNQKPVKAKRKGMMTHEYDMQELSRRAKHECI